MKLWTPEEDAFLRERWGCRGGKASIAKALGRSVEAVRERGYKIGLGPFLCGGEDITYNHLVRIVVGIEEVRSHSYTLERWKSMGFPIKEVFNEKCSFQMVNVAQFWKWAKKNQSALDFSRFEENALGKEPAWAKKKRRIDIENRRLQHLRRCKWSIEEESLLRLMLENGATYADLERELKRTSGAIRRKIYDLYLPKPQRAVQVRWTEDEMRQLVRMINQGYSQDYCAKMMNRSCQAIRGRIEKMHSDGTWELYE